MVDSKATTLAARVLMSILFLVSGYSKLAENAAMQGYMQAHGVPGWLSWPAAAWELTAGLLLLLGLWLRPLCVLLAAWCLLTALIFHTAFSDQNQMINFLKNMTMAGGFLLIAGAAPTVPVLDRPLRRGQARPMAGVAR